MEVAVDGDCGNGSSLCQWWSSLPEAAVGWRDNDAMALSTMAFLASGGGGNGGGRRQLCSGSWCCRHHPFISVDGGSKDAIATTAINSCFHQGQLLLLPSRAAIAIAAAAQSMVNGGGGFC